MNSVRFNDSDGNMVYLTDPGGAGGSYQVIINTFYQGVIYKKDGKWKGHLNTDALSSDDIDAMGDRIDAGTYDIAP